MMKQDNYEADDDMCHICGETNHVNGPYGRKLAQYFSCQKVAEITPNQRFIEIRNKGLCFQYH